MDGDATNASDHQLETLRLFGELVEVREDWGGRLVLCCGEGCAASGVPRRSSIAGGATLALDGDAAEVKAAMRRGELDFVVNTLDEALRALKNEVRVRRPLSVGLIAEADAALREMVERGVLPDLLLIGANQSAQAIQQNESIRALDAAGMALRSMVDAERRMARQAQDDAQAHGLLRGLSFRCKRCRAASAGRAGADDSSGRRSCT